MSACQGSKHKLYAGGLFGDSVIDESASPHSSLVNREKPIIVFNDTLFDFGTIEEGKIVQHDFKFVNLGKAPLIFSSATGTCGCTIPVYPHMPTKPGDSGIINVSFNSTKQKGNQTKTIIIYTNASPNIRLLHIVAEVSSINVNTKDR